MAFFRCGGVLCLLLSVSVVRGSCLLASARSSAAWSAVSSRLPREPRSRSAALLAGMRWRSSRWRCVARLGASRSSALGILLARASGASRLSPWCSPLWRLARPRSGSRAVRSRPRWGSGWRRVRARPSSLAASRCRSRAGSCSRPCRAVLSLRPVWLRLPASRSSSSAARGSLLCSLRCWRALVAPAARGSRCSAVRLSAVSSGSRPARCRPLGLRLALRRAAGCRGVRSRRLAVRLVLARRCSRAVRSARSASAREVLGCVGRAACGSRGPFFRCKRSDIVTKSPSRHRQEAHNARDSLTLVLTNHQPRHAVQQRTASLQRDEENHVVNLEDLLTPRLGSKGRRPRGAMATAAWLKRRSSLWKAASALRTVGGCDLNSCSDDCRRVFSLCHPVSRYLNPWKVSP